MQTSPTAALCALADVVIGEGAELARQDDPHRFGTLAREFDGGTARRRLVMDYQPGGLIRIALELHGTRDAAPHLVELFSTTVQGPVAEVQ